MSSGRFDDSGMKFSKNAHTHTRKQRTNRVKTCTYLVDGQGQRHAAETDEINQKLIARKQHASQKVTRRMEFKVGAKKHVALGALRGEAARW